MIHKKIYETAIKTWGIDNQIGMLIEEAAEVIHAICKLRRGLITEVSVCEELADLEIMLEQMRLIFSTKDIDKFKVAKIKRLKNRLQIK